LCDQGRVVGAVIGDDFSCRIAAAIDPGHASLRRRLIANLDLCCWCRAGVTTATAATGQHATDHTQHQRAGKFYFHISLLEKVTFPVDRLDLHVTDWRICGNPMRRSRSRKAQVQIQEAREIKIET
jgi:hypothetical protein